MYILLFAREEHINTMIKILYFSHPCIFRTPNLEVEGYRSHIDLNESIQAPGKETVKFSDFNDNNSRTVIQQVFDLHILHLNV